MFTRFPEVNTTETLGGGCARPITIPTLRAESSTAAAAATATVSVALTKAFVRL